MPRLHLKASAEQEALELFQNVEAYRSMAEQTSRPLDQPAVFHSSVVAYLFRSHMEVEEASRLIAGEDCSHSTEQLPCAVSQSYAA